MPSLETIYRPLLEAVAFAARAHKGQLRKDGATPYASHVFRVCLVLRHVFGIDDPALLTAAVLHDTIEDTNTDYDDLKEQFGAEVAGYVAVLSKDKRLQEEIREKDYLENLAAASWQVKVCKLADVFDNLMDSHHTAPAQRQRTLKRSAYYLAKLALPESEGAPEAARRAYRTVQALLGELQG